MKSDTKWLRTASQCCAEIGPEDGIAPRLLAKQQKVSKREHKQLQLCKRVNRTMNLLFLDESLDPALRDLVVDRVELSSNGRQFVITVLVDPNITSDMKSRIIDALTNARGYIRTIVAQTIDRKRIPAISFRIAGSDKPMLYDIEV